KPVADAGGLAGWEPVFQPALSGEFVWMPGAGGSLWRVSKAGGERLSRIDPFGDDDPDRFVTSGLAADGGGNVYYTAVAFATGDPWGRAVRGAWLVKVTSAGTASVVPFARLVLQAPAASAPCQHNFALAQLPWPPAPDAVAPVRPCGSQRPGLNAVPAVAPDG